ncbi:hypothetical protein B0H11DRAFT_1943733 [Mycena galericulata]|nr:hypothetical protein B0H11DRAFT_1943733 [Mycena galericulata]
MTVSKLPRPKGMVLFGYPYRFGYFWHYATENAARTVAFRSINGFLPLIGNLAMMFWYMQINANAQPEWRDLVCKIADVHPQWLASLENSAAGDLTIARIGGLIDFSDREHVELFDDPAELNFIVGQIILTKLPIPLYISWGNINAYPRVTVPGTLRDLKFVPDGREIEYLRGLPGQVAFSRWAMTTKSQQPVIATCRDSHPYVSTVSIDTADGPSNELFPPVERNSGQREGESIDKFFARREQDNRSRASYESLQDAQTRQQKEANAAKGSVPGRRGARVYVWEKTNGHYIRRAAGRGNYEDVWEEYGPHQRWYDGFRDEWDVCEMFGPAGGNKSDDDGDCYNEPSITALPSSSSAEYDEADDPDVPSEMLPDGEEPLEKREVSSLVDLARALGIAQTTSQNPVEYDKIAPSLAEMVYLRFGCTATKEPFDTSKLASPAVGLVKKSWVIPTSRLPTKYNSAISAPFSLVAKPPKHILTSHILSLIFISLTKKSTRNGRCGFAEKF